MERNSRDFSSQSYGDQDYLSRFSWPPRSYTCSFCKREFRSAQALGGHMNVHRRDRARLRQLSPPIDGQCPILNLNINPNPNPNFSSPSSSPSSPQINFTLPSLISPSLNSSLSSPSSAASPTEMRKWGLGGTLGIHPLSPRGSDLGKIKSAKSVFGEEEFDDFMEEDGYKVLKKKADFVRLDLEIGVLNSDSKEDLDLELRLGYS